MLQVSVIDRDHYLNFVETEPYRNFLQYPSWADLKAEWKWASELLGWFTGDGQMVGGALVLYRKVPGLNKYLAYIPRGPMIDWFSNRKLSEWFEPLLSHLKQRHVFTVKMDPPLVRKKWSSQTIMQAIQEFQSHGLKNRKLTDIRPDQIFNDVEYVQQELAELGWRKNEGQDSFDTVQPQFVFRLNMRGKSLEQVYSGFYPAWQNKIHQAEQEGIHVYLGTEEDLPQFHHLLRSTAEREKSQVRGLSYFERMFETLIMENPYRVRLYLARLGERILSASLAVRVNGHTWDLYNARHGESLADPASVYLRWKMIQDAYQQGDRLFDFRGISTVLDENNPLFELLHFKLGFGGEACELVGEWDYPVIPMLYWAFDMYMKKR
ncbi:peptidoglycan bridge formation glycyltransferase FemA/FemB family protein [Thermoactinomyces sp. CICC 10521]|uniref:lipid II:glycine glycyltransferase FemX n=1 Tax=Thermoactinomyces sp. CICC 10521 TaxID=2767426 RepID=UPI0018DE94E0|nr:peptidoglycan bridge formation glycyltransferase FemA/FemB family protein [Thermoactinomyces sp. CICC 10521]MBH8607693.1 peptidoglycan bridge formation glycyltransferase FemA/FemB family protein [Thermoactinomyces sp. CICC 10521]